ncbi:MAG: hypothetical protein AAF715_15685 [Myxococcota bacterium]
MPELAQVLDPRARDACAGPRAVLALDIDLAWLQDAGRVVEVRVPRRLPCARCEGGGCDGCGRSGVVRAPENEARRGLRVTLPTTRPGPRSSVVVLRIERPFGPGSEIAQLLLRLKPSDASDPRLSRVAATAVPPPGAASFPRPGWVALLAAVAAAVGWLASYLI